MTSNIDESVNMIGHDHYLESIISESAENTVTQDFNEVLFSHPQNETITPATEMNSNFDELANLIEHDRNLNSDRKRIGQKCLKKIY